MGSEKGLTATPPRLVAGCVEFLDQYLAKEHLVLQTGCRNGLLWLAERAKLVVAFEHNKPWCGIVQQELVNAGALNTMVVCQEKYPELGPRIFGDIKFDLVIVGGLGRAKTILTTWQRLAPGGHIVLDYRKRDLYKGARWYLDSLGWPRVEWYEGERTTSMWCRPSAVLQPQTNENIH